MKKNSAWLVGDKQGAQETANMTYKIAPFLATHSKQSAHARRLGHNELLEREIFIPSAPLPPSPTTQGQISLSLSAFAYAHAGRNENKRERERICIAERPYALLVDFLSACLRCKRENWWVAKCKIHTRRIYSPHPFVLLAVILMRRRRRKFLLLRRNQSLFQLKLTAIIIIGATRVDLLSGAR